MRKLAFFFLLVLAVSAFAEDQPYLVRDLPGLTLHDSMPSGRTFWVNQGNTTWFIALTTSSKTYEIFKTDGTPAGTVQLTNGSGVPESQFSGPFLGLIAGKLVYGGRDAGGDGVFALDTISGGAPVLLGRFSLSYLTNGVVRGDTLYFAGRTPEGEHELWSTNGTALTKLDLLPGTQGAFNLSNHPYVYSAGDWLFFFGQTTQGTGLHRTDGTVANTTLLVPMNPSTPNGDVIVLGNRLLFSPAANQLWVSDGTPAGTSQIGPLPSSSSLDTAGNTGTKVYFVIGHNNIWVTDGTAGGTKATDIFAGLGLNIISGYALGSRLFLTASKVELDTTPVRNVTRLYVSDGTGAGTHALMEIDQHSGYTRGEGFDIAGSYYFRNDDGIHGMELWRTDGNTAQMVVDINPGYRDGIGFLSAIARPDGKVLLAAKDYNTGTEPWITDGTAAGTRMLKNCAEEDSLNGSSPRDLQADGNRLFFIAELNGGEAIGTSDGTAGGTSAVLVDFPWTIGAAAASSGHYFFSTSKSMYASDGTVAGTTPLLDQPSKPYALANGALFQNSAGDLWFSDGTLAGTQKIHSFGDSGASLEIFPAGTFAWLVKSSNIWKTDGTIAGTVSFVPSPAPLSSFVDEIRAGSSTYFIESSSGGVPARLWQSDGTAAGTKVLKTFDQGVGYGQFVGAAGRFVYINANNQLYRSDGTEAGTIALGVSWPCAASGTTFGDGFLFTTFDGNRTLSVWRSDGSAAGTTMLTTSRAPSSELFNNGCRPVVARGNAAYFSNWDASHGWELWTTDGTAAGTKMLADIYPGTKSSLPAELTLAGDRIFFSAESPNIGRELWAIGGAVNGRRRAFRP